MTRKNLTSKVISWLLLSLAAIMIVGTIYKMTMFRGAQIDEILYYLNTGISEGKTDVFADAFWQYLPIAILLAIILIIPTIDIYRSRVELSFQLRFGKIIRERHVNISQWLPKGRVIVSVTAFVLSLLMLLVSFQVPQYIKALMQSTSLYEDHYVDPKAAQLVFPEKKRNLIRIYLESMENTLASEKQGGIVEKSLIPELESLAMDPSNVSFSNREGKIGGALAAQGTTWTVAGMAAQDGGVPLKDGILGLNHNQLGHFKEFLPGSHMLGDLLKEQGYNQVYLFGSNAGFGGRDGMLKQHGGYTIHDHPQMIADGRLPAGYEVFWGYEDQKLFQFAKEDILQLAKKPEPFNVGFLTVDTHFPDGHMDESCPRPHKQRYMNVLECSSSKVGEFVKWVQQQPFGDNTTIVITGDHLGMDSYFYQKINLDPSYARTVYNVIINPAVRPTKPEPRLFSSFDMYPTTLAALGVKIPGDKLALGVNLFGTTPTLVEELGGIDAFNEELRKRSGFYEKKIMLGR